MNHELYMTKAMDLARKGEGLVSPNPMVGAVIVYNNQIVGSGYHQEYGKAHAEVNAIEDAIKNGHEDKLKDSYIYINLEPCSHFGKTPPCVDLIIKHKFKKVIISNVDPNPIVAGRGVKKLEENNIDVITSVLEEEGKRLNEIFFCSMTQKRPFIIFKTAMTLDGKIATYKGDSKWISSTESRTIVHKIRNKVDAILTSSSTVISDNPMLNVRHVKAIKDPIKIVLDRNLKSPLDSHIIKNKPNKTIFIVGQNANREKIKKLKDMNVLIEEVKDCGEFDLKQILDYLYRQGITSILLECGGGLAWSFLKQDLIDKYFLFIAPKVIGGENAITPIEGEGIGFIKNSVDFKTQDVKMIGSDILIEAYRR